MPVEILSDRIQLQQSLQLWRYVKLSTLLLLLDGKAFFPSVATLRSSDPLEGLLYADAPWLIGKLRELKGDDAANELDDWLIARADESEKRNIKANCENPLYFSRALAELYVRELAKRRAVWCWFDSEIESAAMWSIYGHSGIAVGTSLGTLEKALPSNRDFQIAEIKYAKRYPNHPDWFNPESNDRRIHRPHLIKTLEYGHEKEFRVVTSCLPGEKGTLVRGIDWNMLVESIIISPLLPYEEAKAIERLLEQHEWKSKPDIHRSSLLGDIAENEEFGAGFAERWRAQFGENEEPGLPALIKEL
jgi:hypothetical protein